MTIRVAVAMSGGVDSSVACLILKRRGYDVVGFTMKLLSQPISDDLPHAPCCTLDMARDAARICHSLGIPHYTLNLTSEFEESVIVPFIRQYASGMTPNPCLTCNRVMKFGHLLRKAREIGATYIATGHYARCGRIGEDGDWVDNLDAGTVDPAGGRTMLLRGVDQAKDQSYALYELTQDELAHSMFPLGNLVKAEVREMAREAGLPTAETPESQEICFVGRSYRDFLSERGVVPEPGPILDTSGKVLGKHLGIPFYTVGQRRGLGVASGHPLYVVDIDPEKNAVIVGDRSQAYSRRCIVENLNVIPEESLTGPVEGTCMVRYRGKEVRATIRPLSENHAEIEFDEPQFAVTPGQSAVLYKGDLVYAGGTIVRASSFAVAL